MAAFDRGAEGRPRSPLPQRRLERNFGTAQEMHVETEGLAMTASARVSLILMRNCEPGKENVLFHLTDLLTHGAGALWTNFDACFSTAGSRMRTESAPTPPKPAASCL